MFLWIQNLKNLSIKELIEFRQNIDKNMLEFMKSKWSFHRIIFQIDLKIEFYPIKRNISTKLVPCIHSLNRFLRILQKKNDKIAKKYEEITEKSVSHMQTGPPIWNWKWTDIAIVLLSLQIAISYSG